MTGLPAFPDELPIVEELPLFGEQVDLAETWTERRLLDLLAARLTVDKGNGPEWTYAEHVRDAAGFHAGTTIDALALHLWPSRRHELHAFEVKVSRSDWRRELSKPEKAAPWLALVDGFTVVAPRGVVKPDELPDRWGLLEPYRDGLRWTCKPLPLQPVAAYVDGYIRQPPLDRGLVAAFLRAAVRTATRP